MYQKQFGFTLIELAIVLVIVGLLIGSFIGTLGARIDNTRRAEAQADLEIIKSALLGYALALAARICPVHVRPIVMPMLIILLFSQDRRTGVVVPVLPALQWAIYPGVHWA